MEPTRTSVAPRLVGEHVYGGFCRFARSSVTLAGQRFLETPHGAVIQHLMETAESEFNRTFDDRATSACIRDRLLDVVIRFGGDRFLQPGVKPTTERASRSYHCPKSGKPSVTIIKCHVFVVSGLFRHRRAPFEDDQRRGTGVADPAVGLPDLRGTTQHLDEPLPATYLLVFIVTELP